MAEPLRALVLGFAAGGRAMCATGAMLPSPHSTNSTHSTGLGPRGACVARPELPRDEPDADKLNEADRAFMAGEGAYADDVIDLATVREARRLAGIARLADG